jgi:S-formylglutathione hydrolase FrmB
MSQFFTTEIAESGGLHLITVKSNALGQRVDMSVFVPAMAVPSSPVVILLHGVYGSHWAWSVKGKAHLTAQRLIQEGKIQPMILAMPSDGLYGDGSGYVPHQDANFEQWIVEEVPQVLQEKFTVVTTESPLFITGLSMGGYGALRLGAKYAQVFQGFSGLSSITQFEQMAQFVSNFAQLQKDALEQDSVLEWLVKNRTQLPSFRFDCGSEDILIDANRQLHAALTEQGIAHVYEEFPGGHEWPYWEQHIEDSLKFFNESLKH